jgi:hypothetical protein
VVHPRLVEPAQIKNESGQGAWVTYTVTDVDDRYGSVPLNEELRPHGVMFRNAPQYVNAKTEVLDSNELVDLNRDVRYETLADRLRQGPYRALHYVDFTGDGWVQVRCPELDGKLESSEAQAAYSLVTAPDFFPSCDQAVLSEWTSKVHPPRKMRGTIWKERPPDALCDQRYPANLQLPVAPPYKNPFHLRDDSITAVVSHVGSPTVKSGERVESKELARHNHLPDDAAGVFDPGWDVSLDHLPDDERAAHLAAYGLGSPFPEDAKLCAALSAYWPAVSPDTTRLMWPMAEDKLHTTCPLTDEEIGQSGLLPWDGVAGPRVVHVDGQQFAEFADFQHVDYVQNALAGKFSLRLTAAVDSTEYEWRVLAMAAVHTTITPASSRWSDWIVLSFRPVRVGDVVHPRPTILTCDVEEFENMRQAVETSQSLAWGAPLYRFEMITQRSGKKA